MEYQGGNLGSLMTMRQMQNRFGFILGELRNSKGSVLVIGFGDGSLDALLRKINPTLNITSIDINGEYQERVAMYADEVIIGDFISHEFDKTFDFVVSTDVIEHVIETDKFLIKARALLSNGGYFYLQTPNLASWHGRATLLMGFQPEALEVSTVKNYFGKLGPFRHDRAVQHVHVYTYKALREMCEYYGFDVVRAVGIDHRVRRAFWLLPSIAASVCVKLRRKDGRAA